MSEQQQSDEQVPSVKQGENEVKNVIQTPEEQSKITFTDKQTADNGSFPENEKNEKFLIKNRMKTKDRKVSFPDTTVVSGYADPPNPWHGVSGLSTDSLISAYKHHCDKLNLKPLPRLLSQLQVIQDFDTRQETLFLKGERLDYRHIEAIEEIFRRVQFRTVDMEATNLDDESANALFEMIEYYDSTGRLNIAFNKNIGPRGWMSCSRLIKKAPSLEYLDIRNCTVTDQGMGILGRSLRLGSLLTILHMENVGLAGRPLLILVAALKLNELLRELFLADNRLMPSDAIQLGNLLKFNHRLKLLDIRNNHIQDVGLTHLSDGLYEQNLDSGLHTLVLWNNQLTFQGMQSLARALSSTKCLQTLNLGHNNISNEGILRLKDGFLQNRSLLRIGLQAAKISCEGAIALAEYVADSPELLRMDLRENDIKTAGLMALSLSLKHNTTVNRIDLDKEAKKENGVKDYAEQQERLIQDINSYLQRNRELALKRSEEQSAAIETAKAATEEEESAEKSPLEKENEGKEDLSPNQEKMTTIQETSPDSPNPPVDDSPHHKHPPESLTLTEQAHPQESLDSPAFAPDGAVSFSTGSDKVQFLKNVGNTIEEEDEEEDKAQTDDHHENGEDQEDKDEDQKLEDRQQEAGKDNEDAKIENGSSADISVLSQQTSAEQVSGSEDTDSTCALSKNANLTEASLTSSAASPISGAPPTSSLMPLTLVTSPLGTSPPSFDLPRQSSPAASPTRAKRVFRINRVTETSPYTSPLSSPVATQPPGSHFDAITSNTQDSAQDQETETLGETVNPLQPALPEQSSEVLELTHDSANSEATGVADIAGTAVGSGDSCKIEEGTTTESLKIVVENDDDDRSAELTKDCATENDSAELTVDSTAQRQHLGDVIDNCEGKALQSSDDASLQAGPEANTEMEQKAKKNVVVPHQGAAETYQENVEDKKSVEMEETITESHEADLTVQCPADSANTDVDANSRDNDKCVEENITVEKKLETEQCSSAQDESSQTRVTKSSDTVTVGTTVSAVGEELNENTAPPDLWNVDEGETEEKPDFYSNLSVNGMTRELAKVLDSLENGQTEENSQDPSAPNDLRGMVAAALNEETPENDIGEEVSG